MTRAAIVSVLAWLLVAPAGVDARQEEVEPPPSLDRVERLAQEGRTAEARSLLTGWWEAEAGSADRRAVQRALWLRGRLTPDPARARLDFRRLVVEYPGGTYSDRALLRLAQASHAQGDGEEARALIAQLRRDYPQSPTRREAEAWLAEAGPVPSPPPPEVPAGGAELPADAPEGSAGETPDAVREDEARPPATPADKLAGGEALPDVRPEPAGRPAGAEAIRGGAPAPEPEGGAFAVQLGAFLSEARARALADELVAAGLEARLALVEGSRLVRVRVGRFDSLDEAGELLSDLRARGFTATLVRDADREEPIGR